MDQASKGAAALAASDIPTALSAFTQALIQHPTSPDYFVQRATAFTRLSPPRHDLALKDAEYAILLGQKRAKREKIQAGQQRRVVSLYGQGKYIDAKFILETMKRWRSPDNKKDKMEGDIWMAKVDQKLKSTTADDATNVTVTEYPEVDLPNEKIMKKWLESQVKADGTYRFEGELDSTTASSANTTTETTSQSITIVPQAADEITDSTAPAVSKVRHEWYQNSENVIITIYAKGVSKDVAQSSIDIQTDSISISFPDPTVSNTQYFLSLNPLYASIDPSKSTSSIKTTKVEITLCKTIPGQKWSGLQGSSESSTTTKVIPATMSSTISTQDPAIASVSSSQTTKEIAPSYPTSSRTGPKDWDKLATTLTAKKASKPNNPKTKTEPSSSAKMTQTQEPSNSQTSNNHNHNHASPSSSDNEDEVDSDYDTGDAVDSFFKKLYAGADDDTRRAMMKSFQESNGTALSTNWAEVGTKKVEEVQGKDD